MFDIILSSSNIFFRWKTRNFGLVADVKLADYNRDILYIEYPPVVHKTDMFSYDPLVQMERYQNLER